MDNKLLLEGGVGGHMNHPYDNDELTFRQLKDMLRSAAGGQLRGTEKTDGQNLQLSYDVKTGTARAARNKGNIKAGGLDDRKVSGSLREAARKVTSQMLPVAHLGIRTPCEIATGVTPHHTTQPGRARLNGKSKCNGHFQIE